MKKCCCNKHRVVKVKCKTEKVEKNNTFDEFMKTFDVREKRIGIVFKVVYVIAALFASAFLLVSNEFRKGLSESYIVYICFTAFLMHLLYRMVVYIFNELKCLKIKNDEVTEKQREIFKKQIAKAEDNYTRIFNYFSIGGVVSILSGVTLLYVKDIVTQSVLTLVAVIGIILGSVMGNASYKKHVQFWQSVCSIVWTIATISLFAAMAFEVAS